MLLKLSMSGVKSKFKDYLVLLFGLVIAISIFYMFQTLALNACPMLRQGARENITKLMQQRLLNRGYTSLKVHGGADGCFGAGTTTAIKNLQRNKDLSVDGIIGKNTWKALYSK